MKRQVNRVLLDWGACHRLLDELQVAAEHKTLLPRVRFVVDHFAAQAGWPPRPDASKKSATSIVPFAPSKGDKKKRKKDRKKR